MELTMPINEILIRLSLALASGIVLGLNRWIHHKSAGIRTHSLVSIGSAAIVLLIDTIQPNNAEVVSRVLQGVITGIGFLSAGVIIKENNTQSVHGLTTAASIWICGLLGACFGAGAILLGSISLGFIMLILMIGGSLEKLLSSLLGIKHISELPSPKKSKKSK